MKTELHLAAVTALLQQMWLVTQNVCDDRKYVGIRRKIQSNMKYGGTVEASVQRVMKSDLYRRR